ncbi:uncharacterized protein FOMMEDRAFT_158996 [Fomitiporia mediterranea MF3/22]|uniref:uncharacterized protein n=1 Tax=Fomitiporia mediterranea (strain MF3/22) TaxID=694068 RepID=UPI00044085B9|nr:uncharacterized protein FOMMEDRAFT_158996 [Fomitiporia mediterranea MF3/22]EJD00324.1 hypothetical protein FOMMEDRAFT_158996 [Fomitiporia mediterranea MF3/22]
MLQARIAGRVSVIERSGTRTPSHHLSSSRSNHTVDIERSGGVYISVDKHVTIEPERVVQNPIQMRPSLTMYGEDREHSSIELSDLRKGASIA